MLNKNPKLLCPFREFKKCNNKCSFYRSGIRVNDLTNESFPFEACAINIIADNLEAMHNRTYMMQQEVGKAKDAMIMKTLVELEVLEKKKCTEEILKIANPCMTNMEKPKEIECSVEENKDK